MSGYHTAEAPDGRAHRDRAGEGAADSGGGCGVAVSRGRLISAFRQLKKDARKS